MLAHRLVRSVYQPIVDLETREIIGFEALARGPVGTTLEQPIELFAAADRAGVRAELDWECRAAALRGAIEAGLGRHRFLFMNLEASTFGTPAPDHLAEEIVDAAAQLNVIAEITEREIADDPAALLQGLGALRGLGFGVAIDDLGTNAESLALLPFLEPDVIKLDMTLIQQAGTRRVAATSAAVRADAERRGCLVVAEGIETDAHLQRALVLGATHGQGWLFARPGPLDSFPAANEFSTPIKLTRGFRTPPPTPWDMVANSPAVHIAPKELLQSLSMVIEQYPVPESEAPVLLAAFQHEQHFTGATARRYAELAERSTFVGVLGAGLSKQPLPRVRGGSISSGHPLADEWTVVHVGPHFAAALIAKDMGDGGPESERRFQYVVTHDRETVVSAAASLLRLIEPLDGPRRRSSD